MLAGLDRGQTREVFFRAWRAHREGRPLEGVEKLIVQVALRHPEYHPVLEQSETARERDYFPEAGETNPFLHLGMHIAIEEQLSIDQPAGIRDQYRRLLSRYPDEHAVQHRMMECLGEMLWQAGRQATAPQQTVYLDCLRRLTSAP
ncbi:MAG: DUF1841 family protein [Pseudomonadota bacterium]